MKRILFTTCLMFSLLFLGFSAFAQKVETEGEMFAKISRLTQTKKVDDQEKAYKLGKIFLQKFGTGNSPEVKKIKDFVANYEMVALGKMVEEDKTAEAFTFGKQVLITNPDNSHTTMVLAYAGYQALVKKQDKTFSKDSIFYAQMTLRLFAENKLPQTFLPFENQTVATALMYYIIGNFSIDNDMNEAANNFYKAVQLESKIKAEAKPYYIIALNYHTIYWKLAADFESKYPSGTTETDASRAANEKLEKLLNRMMDAYARAIKLGEAQKLPDAANWKTIFSQIYIGFNQSEAGMNEYLDKILTTPMQDPSTL